MPCLSDQESVEWIPMVKGQGLDGSDVGEPDGEQVKVVRLTMLDDEALDGRWQAELPE